MADCDKKYIFVDYSQYLSDAVSTKESQLDLNTTSYTQATSVSRRQTLLIAHPVYIKTLSSKKVGTIFSDLACFSHAKTTEQVDNRGFF
jgi:hypothetical protein